MAVGVSTVPSVVAAATAVAATEGGDDDCGTGNRFERDGNTGNANKVVAKSP